MYPVTLSHSTEAAACSLPTQTWNDDALMFSVSFIPPAEEPMCSALLVCLSLSRKFHKHGNAFE